MTFGPAHTDHVSHLHLTNLLIESDGSTIMAVPTNNIKIKHCYLNDLTKCVRTNTSAQSLHIIAAHLLSRFSIMQQRSMSDSIYSYNKKPKQPIFFSTATALLSLELCDWTALSYDSKFSISLHQSFLIYQLYFLLLTTEAANNRRLFGAWIPRPHLSVAWLSREPGCAMACALEKDFKFKFDKVFLLSTFIPFVSLHPLTWICFFMKK